MVESGSSCPSCNVFFLISTLFIWLFDSSLASAFPYPLASPSPQTMSTFDDDASAYNAYASAAVELSDAHFMDDTFRVIRSVRDIDANKRRRYLYTIPTKVPKSAAIPQLLSDSIVWQLPSPSGNKMAVLVKSDDTGKQQELEIWTHKGQQLERRIRLDDKIHGKLVSGFGDPCWNPDETALLYTAERVPPKTKSFFERHSSDESPAKEGSTTVGGQFTLGLGRDEHWGEKFSKQQALLDLFVVHVETGRVGLLENVPGAVDRRTTLRGYCLGQAIWSPDGNAVVYVGWDAGGGPDMPRRLGLIHCQQRSSKIYVSAIKNLMGELSRPEGGNDKTVQGDKDTGFLILTPNVRIARSPRFSPANKVNQSRLLFLAAEQSFDTHCGCFGLHVMDWREGLIDLESHKIVVDQVDCPRNSPAECGEVMGLRFPGLFMLELPNSGFVDSDTLLATTQWGCCTKVVQIRISDGSVRLLNAVDDATSEVLLGIGTDGSAAIVVERSNEWPSIRFKQTGAQGSPETSEAFAFYPVVSSRFSPVTVFPSLNFTADVHEPKATPFRGVDADIIVQSILLLPDKAEHSKPPLIVSPHGGPHAAFATCCYHSLAFLCGYGGYAVLMVNYRGSTGYGRAAVEALPTRIGVMDVADVVAATNEVIQTGLVDKDRVGICGGSHGGFLTAHCTSQHPELFKAAATRNPVVNIASMVTATDIPDWCFVETLGSDYDWTTFRPVNKDELSKMWDSSPVQHIQGVRAPTLVALGLSDLRVPPSQGLEWYHALRSKGIPTKLLTYPEDDHAIAGVASEADHWVNVKRWFDDHL